MDSAQILGVYQLLTRTKHMLWHFWQSQTGPEYFNTKKVAMDLLYIPFLFFFSSLRSLMAGMWSNRYVNIYHPNMLDGKNVYLFKKSHTKLLEVSFRGHSCCCTHFYRVTELDIYRLENLKTFPHTRLVFVSSDNFQKSQKLLRRCPLVWRRGVLRWCTFVGVCWRLLIEKVNMMYGL